MCVCVSCSVMSHSLQLHGLKLTRLLCPWNFPGKNIGEGCHSLLQGIFPTPGIETRSSTLQADSLLSEPLGKPTNYKDILKLKISSYD